MARDRESGGVIRVGGGSAGPIVRAIIKRTREREGRFGFALRAAMHDAISCASVTESVYWPIYVAGRGRGGFDETAHRAAERAAASLNL